MNKVKTIAVAAAFLCAATVANAQEGMTFGARLGYSVQSLGKHDMGLLGGGAGLVVNIPAGPAIIAPEIAFMYRTNYSYEQNVPGNAWAGIPARKVKSSQTEFAVSIPIMAKYPVMDKLYTAAGIQADIPIGAEMCQNDVCAPMDGKEPESQVNPGYVTGNPDRSFVDLGAVVGVSYMVMPNLSVDARYIYGLLNSGSQKISGLTVDFDPLNSISVGATYFF